jgi:quercetin dioxygenase-like cupin family protein
MRQVVLTTGEFTTEDEAMALAEAAGFVPMAFDLEPSGEDHWHDFGAKVYVVEGSVKITDVDSGSSYELTSGCTIHADPGAVHREEGDPYRAVVAFDCDPATLTMPVDKAPADRST